MRGLLKKHELRQLLLIENLQNRSEPIALADMAKILGYSERSITLDIIAIQEKLPFINLKLIHKQITMELPPAYNLSYIYQRMFKDNSAIKLLERLFLNKHTHLSDLINLLELSQATIYSLIERINQKIDTHYDIRIDTNPFRLTGEEEKIRAFFSQLFSNTYTPFEWPFLHTDEASVAELVIRISKTVEVPLNYTGINYLKYLVAVSAVRLKQGYEVPIDYEKATMIHQVLTDRLFMSDRMTQLFNVLGLPFNQNTISQLFHVLINADYVFPSSLINSHSKNIDTRNESFHNLRSILESLKEEFSLQFNDLHSLILNLHNTAMLNNRDIDSGNIMNDDKAIFIEELSIEFPTFISRVTQLFRQYYLNLKIEADTFFINRLIHHLFIEWKNLYTQLLHQNEGVRAVILCNYDANHALFLKEYFEIHFGKAIRFNVYDDTQLSIARLRNLPDQIILSTFHIPFIEGKCIININFFPSTKDLDKLHRVLHQVKNTKKRVDC